LDIHLESLWVIQVIGYLRNCNVAISLKHYSNRYLAIPVDLVKVVLGIDSFFYKRNFCYYIEFVLS